MQLRRHGSRALRGALLLASVATAQTGWAAWSFNLGYHNPPGALVGANLLYYGQTWGFEVGLGWLDLKAEDTDTDTATREDDDKDSLSLHLGGGANFKYFLAQGTVKPYLQGGFGLGFSGQAGKEAGADANLGGPYGGIGLLIGGNPLYVYVSINKAQSTFVQAGLGFGLQ